MKIIAHRGLLQGPDKTKENTIECIESCIKIGFDVEIDILKVEGSNLYIGHDEYNALLNIDILYKIKDKLWIHAKTIDVFEYLQERDKDKQLNYFYHTNEDFVLTSRGYIWAYPGKVVKNSVWLFPENDITKIGSYDNFKNTLSYHIGVCTDYPLLVKHIIESK